MQYLADNISRHLGAIEQLGQTTENWDCLLVFCNFGRLGETKFPTINFFLNFLRECPNFDDTLDYKCQQTREKTNFKANRDLIMVTRKETSRVLVFGQNTLTCNYCKGGHAIYTCEDYLKLFSINKNQFIKENSSICINCLRHSHSRFKCKIGPYKICKRWHNTLHHNDNGEAQSQGANTQEATNSNANVHSSGVLGEKKAQVLFTEIVSILDKFNKYHQVRALLDCGS